MKVMLGDEQLRGGTDSQVDRIISKVVTELEYGDQAWISLDDEMIKEGDRSTNFLIVSLNRSTGYGGFVWFVDARFPRKGGIYDSVWVSDAPEPPGGDPDVITDIHCPVFLDRKSAIPLAVVREVIEEYWRTGTGDRPNRINWTPGHMNGSRNDTETPPGRISTDAKSAFEGLVAAISSGEISSRQP
ncbi:Imm1 family immunity protein [Kitasatospora fiedleri]|uniref:Imm1 family immunity protein n=1 Tax=Kitasatospora fiedleri TaxID=2991545 RepID=UPI00249C4501|nr:Imm1 family immunity protein [Kitasatospora fiedleri]